MVRVSHAIAEIANIAPDTHQAYVGAAAFAHKAGLHASAIKVDPVLYNHIDPSVVGNDMRILVTEMAGRASVELKSRELGLDLAGHPDALSPGHRAGQGAGGGRLVVRGRRRVASSCWCATSSAEAAGAPVRAGVVPGASSSTARTARWSPRRRSRSGVRGERVIATAEGNGPVNALDEALRRRWRSTTRSSPTFELADYKVRILRGQRTAPARSPGCWWRPTDGAGEWTTVGVHENVVEACWLALVDALAYAGLRTALPAVVR